MDPNAQLTPILQQMGEGQDGSLERVFPLVYDELRQMAMRYFGHERKDHTLQPTALVHEAFLRLVNQRQIEWKNRAHFLGVASTMMRRVLLDYARGHQAQRRGGAETKILLEDAYSLSASPTADFLALDESLQRLEKLDPKQARVVELRFFGGLSVTETAEVLGLSEPTVKRYWNSAKAFLHRELTRGGAGDTGTVESGP
jgi:RNA polymerase sigma-70 factor, ECF subfamily